jgi:uncharacterized membrane protein (DUF4010 family)
VQQEPVIIDPVILGFAVALGIGLLIGAERERRKGEGPTRSPAGLRTFTIASLAGGISVVIGGEVLLAITTAGVILLSAAAYWRLHEEDPGLTTEIALIVTTLLGGLSMQRPVVAAGLAVTIAGLLLARTRLHYFVRTVLTEDELRDGLILAGATLVVLPLLPDRPMGPFSALNPRSIWIVAILLMLIGALGYVAVRVLGARFGLPLAGLASGFISSAATIAAMGVRATQSPDLLGAAVAAAVLSTVATIVQMATVLAATSMPTLQAMSVALILSGFSAAAYGAVFTAFAMRQQASEQPQAGRAFSIEAALGFAVILSGILVLSAALREWFGEVGIIVAAALAGFVDTHSAAISVASLVASGKISASEAVIPILAGLSTNTISKGILAAAGGGRSFWVRVVPGLIIVALAAWIGALGIPLP